MSRLTAHIISHTHWDREWFLTSEITNRWIGGLIDKIKRLAEQNPNFQYFLDGQTLVIEDLLKLEPGYRATVEQLVRQGNLLIGPYYCQPDWRLTAGETLLRNLLYGQQDMQTFGVQGGAGWLVDTFGHISQVPQLHRLFGLSTVYIWRGAPRIEPYFIWEGPDGSRLFTTNLFGGYRNLYGVTRTPEIGVRRLLAEVDKLKAYYPTADIPLFDGYDLEDNPEDPLSFYETQAEQLPEGLRLKAVTPEGFAGEMREKLESLPVLPGELNSGKYGAVFPGSLSTRIYLKVMASDCEVLLYRVCEPLAALAAYMGRPYDTHKYETWSRALLRNAVHDCICGVSIDQVHEKMEVEYRRSFEKMRSDVGESLAYLLNGYEPGVYCASTNPAPFLGWEEFGKHVYPLRAEGVGVWRAGEGLPMQREERPVEAFSWQNEHYQAKMLPDGRLRIDNILLGDLLVYEEHGDTYSDERGPLIGALALDGMLLIEQESELHAVLRFSCSLEWTSGRVSATVRLTFDHSPLLRWQVELEGRGVDYRVEMSFETGLSGQIYAGMPFDMVSRPSVDRDLLPRQLENGLAAILIGQRELGEVRSFPFQEYVAISDGAAIRAVLARGLHAYQVGEDDQIKVTLLRAVEWLAKPDLPGRLGDAGPGFYVPDARCERSVRHELAFAWLEGETLESEFLTLNAGYQNPPLLVEVGEPNEGFPRKMGEYAQTGEWVPGGLREQAPMSSLHIREGKLLARLFNPTRQPLALSSPYHETDTSGKRLGTIQNIPPKRILTVELPAPSKEAQVLELDPEKVRVLNMPSWRVGPNCGSPDPAVMERLRQSIERLEREVSAAEVKLDQATGGEAYFRQHRVYVLQRELLEQRLSLRLNEIKLSLTGNVTDEYLFEPDEQVVKIGYELNQMRIQRRIYDYVVQMGERKG